MPDTVAAQDKIDWSKRRESLLGTGKSGCLPAKIPLPMFPEAVQEFNRRAEDPQVSLAELAKVIERDAGLTVELLAQVNSSAHGLRHRVSSVQQALSLLGKQRTKTCLLTSALRKGLSKVSSKLINLKLYWAGSLERALFAREVALLMKADAELAYVAALLQDFLLPILSNEYFPQYSTYIDQQHQPGADSLVVFEQNTFGWDHATAAAQLAFQWGFPDELVCSLHLHHQGLALLLDANYANTSAVAVALSSLLPDTVTSPSKGLTQLIQLDARWSRLQLTQLAERVEQQFQAQKTETTRMHYLTFKQRLEKQMKDS